MDRLVEVANIKGRGEESWRARIGCKKEITDRQKRGKDGQTVVIETKTNKDIRSELCGNKRVQELCQDSGTKHQSSKTHSQPAAVQQMLHCKLLLPVWQHETSPQHFHPQLFIGR